MANDGKPEECFSHQNVHCCSVAVPIVTREGPSHFSSSVQPPVLCLKSGGESFTFKWEDPPLGTGFDPSLDSSLRTSANYNK